MKKLFYPLAFALSALLFIYSCSTEEDATPPPVPTPIVKYTISLSAGEGGSVSTTGGQYESGQTLNVTATPQAEYVFKSWSDGNTNATRTITVSSNTNLTATFEKKKYPLTINIQGEGSVTEEIVSTGKTTEYDSGTTVRLTAIPNSNENWEFIGWVGDIESSDSIIEIEISKAKSVEAKFMRYFNYNKPSYELDDPGFWVDYFSILGYPDKRGETVQLYTGSYPLYQIAVGMPEVFADFDYDGYLDIMFAPSVMTQPPGGFGNEPLWFFKNEGDNQKFTFSKELTINNHLGTFGASAGLLGDFNNDGKPDIVYAEGGKDVYLGSGTTPTMLLSKESGFEMKDISSNSMMYGQAASGDIDNDGDLDVIMGGLGALTVFINDGFANFTEYIQYVDDSYGYKSDNSIIELLEPVTSGGGFLNVDLFDINKDGYLDLIGGWENAGRQLAIYYGNGKNFSKDRMKILPYTKGWENLMNLNFYDVDDDGNIEIIVGRSDLYVTNGWYMELLKLGDNGDYYIVENGFDNTSATQIEFFLNTNVRDLDGNGYVDVFCRDRGQGGNGEFRFEWNGTRFEKRF